MKNGALWNVHFVLTHGSFDNHITILLEKKLSKVENENKKNEMKREISEYE